MTTPGPEHPRTNEIIFDHHAGGVTVKDSDGDPFLVAGDVDELVAEGGVRVAVSLAAEVTFVTHGTPIRVAIDHRGEGGDLKTAVVRPAVEADGTDGDADSERAE